MNSRAFAARRRAGVVVSLASILALAWAFTGGPSSRPVRADGDAAYASFEGPQVHPLAITPDGDRLLAVNTPNGTLSVFDLSGATPHLVDEIPVGLEPVSVAARTDDEAWVVNWLSDSVSVVNLAAGTVRRTIDVGDEPEDVVFAGPSRETAYVSVAGARAIKTFAASDPEGPLSTIPIRGRQPRALATDPTGSRVFVSVFMSGNGTTIVPPGAVKSLGGPPPPSPAVAPGLPKPPDVGLIVKQRGKKWIDERGKGRWKKYVKYSLADVDLVVIDASAAEPSVAKEIRSIGTNISGAVLDPTTDRLFVANSDAHNLTRFEPNLRARFMDSRVSVVDLTRAEAAKAVDLNPHVDLSSPGGSASERSLSLALPADVARAADGTIYVAATGSAKVGVLDANGALTGRIVVGNGPTGLAVDDRRGALYVLNRTDETVSVVDMAASTESGRVTLGVNPEPADVRAGRKIFYDSSFSAHGTVACASCHLNGHLDGLAWDLGDPTGEMQTVTGPPLINLFPTVHFFHPMKGPMVTQSLRATGGTEPLHWRGDRASLDDFNPAFVSLLGAPRELDESELVSFKAFVSSLAYPPNPNENADRTLPNPVNGPSAERGRSVYLDQRTDRRIFTCNDCHAITPGFGPGTNGLIIPGIVLVGLDNVSESQDIKVPQLRGSYEKAVASFKPGERVDGFGLIHDGGIDNLDTFLHTANFVFQDPDSRSDLVAFVLALDTGTAPAVGLQVTIDGNGPSAEALARVELLSSQAERGNCDLIVTEGARGARRSFVYQGGGVFADAATGVRGSTMQDLLGSAAPGAEATFIGVPPGRGRSIAASRR